MATTPNLNLELPTEGSYGWGEPKVNANFTKIDTEVAALKEAATVQGTATSGDVTTLTDTSLSMGIDAFKDGTAIIYRGTTLLRVELVISNTINSITMASGTAIAVGDKYTITPHITTNRASRGVNQSNIASIVYDTFDRADGVLNGQVTASGQTWALQGTSPGTTTITDRKMTSPDNVYAYLPFGGTVTDIYGTFSFDSGTDNSNLPLTLIADNATNLNKMLHLNFGPKNWSLTKRVAGEAPPWAVMASGSSDLLTDGTVYGAGMRIVGNTVEIHAPDGTITTVTDTDVGVIDPQYGAWQILPSAGGAVGYWHSVGMGESVARQFASNGFAAPMSEVRWLKGVDITERKRLEFTVTGAGWYRVANEDTLATFILGGDVSLTARDSVSAIYWKSRVYAKAASATPSIETIYQRAIVASPVTQMRLSTGAANVALDIYVNSATATQISIDFEGFFTPVDTPVVGATALTSGSAVVGALTSYKTTVKTTLTGAGWYRISDRATFATFAISGNVRITATDPARACVWEFDAEAKYNATPRLSQRIGSIITGPPVSLARLSTDSGGLLVGLDIYLPFADAVNLTIDFDGAFSPVLNPVVGATVLPTKSETLTLVVDTTSYNIWATAFSAVIPDGIDNYVMTPAGTLASGTLAMPVNPTHNQIVTISSSQTITAFTLNPSAGHTIINAVTTLAPAPAGAVRYVFNEATSAWHPC